MVAEATRQSRLPFLGAEVLRRVQERRVRATIAYACAHVPYYRETLRKLILRPTDFRDARDLAQLPSASSCSVTPSTSSPTNGRRERVLRCKAGAARAFL